MPTVVISIRMGSSETGEWLLDAEDMVDLNDDDVQLAAASLAHGLIEDMWALLEDS